MFFSMMMAVGTFDVGAMKDAAVRFTPGQELRLQSISAEMCYAYLYGSQFPVTVTVWSDDSGSMGSVLYSNQVSNWVGDPDTWNTFNINLDSLQVKVSGQASHLTPQTAHSAFLTTRITLLAEVCGYGQVTQTGQPQAETC